uniref:SET domain-containing protein n=1 Tax=Romanomermis culicivorax TaxID=13658 RepID=A0A915IEG0_ROMCU
MRKEKDWFSFYAHKCRNPVPKRCGIPNCGSTTPEYNRSLYRWISKAPLLYCKRSGVHKVGIFAGQRIERGQFVAEYVGQIIRNCLLDRKEKYYRD